VIRSALECTEDFQAWGPGRGSRQKPLRPNHIRSADVALECAGMGSSAPATGTTWAHRLQLLRSALPEALLKRACWRIRDLEREFAKSVTFLRANLSATKTRARPHMSNDNPFSQAQFKMLTYSPMFPERLARSGVPDGLSVLRSPSRGGLRSGPDVLVQMEEVGRIVLGLQYPQPRVIRPVRRLTRVFAVVVA